DHHGEVESAAGLEACADAPRAKA
ncbi:MAG: hypothetical protein RL187_718, partial [Actinomycetota bacterium]